MNNQGIETEVCRIFGTPIKKMTPKEFICPRCGGKYFGAFCDPKGVKPDWSIVKCHDQHEIGCKWWGTWDDIKERT